MIYKKYLFAVVAMMLALPAGAATVPPGFSVTPGSFEITYNGPSDQSIYGQVATCDGRGMELAIGDTAFPCDENTTPFQTGPFAASEWFAEDDADLGFSSEFTGVSANWLGELNGNVGFPFVSTRDDGTRALYGVGFGADGTGFLEMSLAPFSDSDSPMSPIPLPAAAWMLIAALGSLGVFSAFRRKGAG